jgi:hypothetical protein
VLETANVKMGNVVSDVFGVSGQDILQALLDHSPKKAEERKNWPTWPGNDCG